MERTSRFPAVFGLLALLAAVVPTEAQAEAPYMRPRLGLRGGVGIGGEALFNGSFDYKDDLQATAGVLAEVEVPISRGYSLGVEGGAQAWRSDLADSFQIDRNLLFDLSLVNRFRLAWGEESSHGAFFLAVPIGATYSHARDAYGAEIGEVVGMDAIELGRGGGLNVGARLGIQVFFGEVFGLTVEGGYQYRLLRHRVIRPFDDDSARVRFGQGVLQAGVVFAF